MPPSASTHVASDRGVTIYGLSRYAKRPKCPRKLRKKAGRRHCRGGEGARGSNVTCDARTPCPVGSIGVRSLSWTRLLVYSMLYYSCAAGRDDRSFRHGIYRLTAKPGRPFTVNKQNRNHVISKRSVDRPLTSSDSESPFTMGWQFYPAFAVRAAQLYISLPDACLHPSFSFTFFSKTTTLA